ncbi:hypothetical protein CcaverHIS641_0505590 [Cutaneotrichosporon cavernicola]|nr:hypothetical protein CcaverHIS641_0505590 [Cutaneotrichosporon cavernicola]
MSITLAYTLDPPAGITAPAPPKDEHSFAISPGAGRSNTEAYYAAASTALKSAQVQANEVFTAWKDAVGDAEKHKENVGNVGKGQGKAARGGLNIHGPIDTEITDYSPVVDVDGTRWSGGGR